MPGLSSVYWPKWDTYDLYQYDFFRKNWTMIKTVMPTEKFLFFSSICHMPEDMGMFILGGSDSDDNFSRRCLYFKHYKRFEERVPMHDKRAFFPSIFHIQST